MCEFGFKQKHFQKKNFIDFLRGPDRCIALPILSVGPYISLLQVYRKQHICSSISADIKTVF